ncbi:MAG: NTP transferase domain-containing protein [Nitrospirae bacterium]|nr:NTP transferase domain-containing protein [Nitrospirota bacterium]
MDIPVVILCGGKGERIGRITEEIPKPLIRVGDRPILWHVMKIYASQGFNHFILCLGYKGEKIKEYFENNNDEGWQIQFVDTGLESTKSERIQQIKDLIKGDSFFLAYGDDVANINLPDLLKFHKRMGLTATITIVRMISHFGLVTIDEKNIITEFKEKPLLDEWMNGGFMVMDKKIFDCLTLGELEKEIFEKLVELKQICAYKHKREWKSMNTLKDNIRLNILWNKGKAFWKIWE